MNFFHFGGGDVAMGGPQNGIEFVESDAAVVRAGKPRWRDPRGKDRRNSSSSGD
jgi:hypothetical protein